MIREHIEANPKNGHDPLLALPPSYRHYLHRALRTDHRQDNGGEPWPDGLDRLTEPGKRPQTGLGVGITMRGANAGR